MNDSIPDRYERNPMLAVLENYVLDTLGLLPAEKSKMLATILSRTFGGNDWKQAVREQFNLPADTDDTLRLLWKQLLEEADATQSQEPPDPETFARETVDEMFKGLGQ
ncbi:MAG TPA: hypothetical protein VHQ47_04130 [Phycisphaerae bacterium]|nr:hypothetical protein [Phycisphaerae bacterium]